MMQAAGKRNNLLELVELFSEESKVRTKLWRFVLNKFYFRADISVAEQILYK